MTPLKSLEGLSGQKSKNPLLFYLIYGLKKFKNINRDRIGMVQKIKPDDSQPDTGAQKWGTEIWTRKWGSKNRLANEARKWGSWWPNLNVYLYITFWR